jgi:hypothetical protein
MYRLESAKGTIMLALEGAVLVLSCALYHWVKKPRRDLSYLVPDCVAACSGSWILEHFLKRGKAADLLQCLRGSLAGSVNCGEQYCDHDHTTRVVS